jgi:hypothetical protein
MLVLRRVEQPSVGRQDYDEREWDDSAQQHSGRDPNDARPGKLCGNGKQQAQCCKVSLHDSGSAVARRKFGRS